MVATALAALLPLAGLLSPHASAQNLQALNQYSVITEQNFTTQSDVEGRTLVGGNFTGTNSATFGNQLQNKVPSTDLVLRVAGSIASGNSLNLNAGSLEVGTATSRSINYNGGGHQIVNPGVSYQSIFDTLNSASSTLASATANSTASIPTGQPGPLTFNATANSSGTAIFNVSGALVFNNSSVQQLQIAAGSGVTSIVINVAGTTINWTTGNMVGLFTQTAWRSNIVWNFYQATSIYFGNNMMGQVLAPLADVTTGSNVDGSIYAKSLNAGGEVHLPGYGGTIVVPEPAAPALLGLVGFIMILRRRRVA